MKASKKIKKLLISRCINKTSEQDKKGIHVHRILLELQRIEAEFYALTARL